MKVNLIVHSEKGNKDIIIEKGAKLWQTLIENSFEITAPCGGNGTCGKCRVQVNRKEFTTACQYIIENDTEVHLPLKREMQILSNQYNQSINLPSEPGKESELSSYPFGMAIDIGTTTVVLYLVNLITGVIHNTTAFRNPQTAFGADIISRINYGAGQEKKIKKLQNVLIAEINKETVKLLELNQVDSTYLVRIAVVGNTSMLHMLLGVDALPIALAPFKPVFTDSRVLNARSTGFHAHPEAELILGPSISAYVGADIVAGLASLKITSSDKKFLYIDVGTNGEIALVTPGKIYSCATAAGPAFEGASISHGMTASGGAICQFGDDGFRTISDLPALGICGSGLIDIVAFLLRKGMIDNEGLMEKEFLAATGTGTDKNYNIIVNQQDIREVQLAKSAISAGINILLKEAGYSKDDLDNVVLAGGFGNYLDIENSVRIGLLPDVEREIIIQVGNAAGTGSVLLLKSFRFLKHMETIINRNQYTELSTHPDFTMEYAMGMYF